MLTFELCKILFCYFVGLFQMFLLIWLCTHLMIILDRLMAISITIEPQFSPLAVAIKSNMVHNFPFFNITEAMEVLHIKPYSTNRPVENTNRKADIVWHQIQGNQTSRPPLPLIASLYNGFAVRMHLEKRAYLVYNNERHLFQSQASLSSMGFSFESIVVFIRKRNLASPHRILDNIPIGDPVPEEGIIVRITPNYVLKPRCSL